MRATRFRARNWTQFCKSKGRHKDGQRAHKQQYKRGRWSDWARVRRWGRRVVVDRARAGEKKAPQSSNPPVVTLILGSLDPGLDPLKSSLSRWAMVGSRSSSS